jgi:hypothetical protein
MVLTLASLSLFLGYYIQPEGGIIFRVLGSVLLIILGVAVFMNVLYLGWGFYNVLQYKIRSDMYNGTYHAISGAFFVLTGVRLLMNNTIQELKVLGGGKRG